MASAVEPRSLKQLLQYEGPGAFYEDRFLAMIEDHLPILRLGSTELRIEPNTAEKYRGDFYGVMTHASIPSQYWYVTMRINGLTSPIEYETSMELFYVPDYNYIEKLRSTYMTLQRIS